MGLSNYYQAAVKITAMRLMSKQILAKRGLLKLIITQMLFTALVIMSRDDYWGCAKLQWDQKMRCRQRDNSNSLRFET